MTVAAGSAYPDLPLRIAKKKKKKKRRRRRSWVGFGRAACSYHQKRT
jgi:hypothetical protein